MFTQFAYTSFCLCSSNKQSFFLPFLLLFPVFSVLLMCHQPPLFFCSSPISYTHALAFPDVCRDDVMADRRHWTPILLFSSRKHSSQTRQKSKALIRSQTTLTEQCLNQSSSPVISTVVWVFWVTACLSLNSHKGYPPSDPITHGKCFKCLSVSTSQPCITNGTWTSQNMWTPGLSTCGSMKTTDTERIRWGREVECCWGC